ncbi:hypothetical protein J0S82_012760, partial [Galemys pyrenaicus]
QELYLTQQFVLKFPEGNPVGLHTSATHHGTRYRARDAGLATPPCGTQQPELRHILKGNTRTNIQSPFITTFNDIVAPVADTFRNLKPSQDSFVGAVSDNRLTLSMKQGGLCTVIGKTPITQERLSNISTANCLRATNSSDHCHGACTLSLPCPEAFVHFVQVKWWFCLKVTNLPRSWNCNGSLA